MIEILEVIDGMNRRGYKCVVCLEETLTFPRSCCSAHVCAACMGRHVKLQVTFGVWKVVCPAEGCDTRLPEDELLAVLDETQTREVYQRLKVDSYAVPYTKTCPHCKLITAVKARSTEPARYHTHGLEITCQECKFKWCFRCHGPAHPGMTCEARPENQFTAWAGDKLYGEFHNAVECPNCKTYVQHSGGCNNMTCAVCGKDFCYLCKDKTCIHDGFVFGGEPQSVHDLVNHVLLQEEIAHVLSAINSQPSVCRAWWETICSWCMAALIWADDRSSTAGVFCSALWITLAICLLALLFPISVPVSIIIWLALPRSRLMEQRLRMLLEVQAALPRLENAPQRRHDSDNEDDVEDVVATTVRGTIRWASGDDDARLPGVLPGSADYVSEVDTASQRAIRVARYSPDGSTAAPSLHRPVVAGADSTCSLDVVEAGGGRGSLSVGSVFTISSALSEGSTTRISYENEISLTSCL